MKISIYSKSGAPLGIFAISLSLKASSAVVSTALANFSSSCVSNLICTNNVLLDCDTETLHSGIGKVMINCKLHRLLLHCFYTAVTIDRGGSRVVQVIFRNHSNVSKSTFVISQVLYCSSRNRLSFLFYWLL